jgi:hypothetical protein
MTATLIRSKIPVERPRVRRHGGEILLPELGGRAVGGLAWQVGDES